MREREDGENGVRERGRRWRERSERERDDGEKRVREREKMERKDWERERRWRERIEREREREKMERKECRSVEGGGETAKQIQNRHLMDEMSNSLSQSRGEFF